MAGHGDRVLLHRHKEGGLGLVRGAVDFVLEQHVSEDVALDEAEVRLGAVGPHVRASGVNIDVRRDAPYCSYGDFEFDIPVVDSGDVFARVVVRALECYESIKIIQQALENLPEGPINLGNPHEFTIKQLAELVIELTGSKSQIIYEPLPSDDPTQRQPIIDKAKEILGWEPTVQLREGLVKTIEYFDGKLKGER